MLVMVAVKHFVVLLEVIEQPLYGDVHLCNDNFWPITAIIIKIAWYKTTTKLLQSL